MIWFFTAFAGFSLPETEVSYWVPPVPLTERTWSDGALPCDAHQVLLETLSEMDADASNEVTIALAGWKRANLCRYTRQTNIMDTSLGIARIPRTLIDASRTAEKRGDFAPAAQLAVTAFEASHDLAPGPMLSWLVASDSHANALEQLEQVWEHLSPDLRAGHLETIQEARDRAPAPNLEADHAQALSFFYFLTFVESPDAAERCLEDYREASSRLKRVLEGAPRSLVVADAPRQPWRLGEPYRCADEIDHEVAVWFEDQDRIDASLERLAR